MKTTNDFVADRIKELVIKEPKGKLLDIGPGHGMNAKMLATLGFDVHVCDYSQELLDKLEFKKKMADLNNEDLPYKEGFFDVVVCTEIVEHLENAWHLVRESHRVLKKNGVIVISTPYMDSLIQRLRFLFTGMFFKFPESQSAGGHISPMHCFELTNTLLQNGFHIEDITFNRSFVPILRLSLPPSWTFGELIMIKARKK